MSEMSYVQVIEHYRQHKESINELMASILNGINDPLIFNDESKLLGMLETLKEIIRLLRSRISLMKLVFNPVITLVREK